MKEKKNLRLLISVSLAVLIAALFTGCSSNNGDVLSASDISKTDAISSSADITAPPYADSPVEYYGELKVSGNQIISENTGRNAQVTGMSFFWSNWSAKYYKAEYVRRMADEFGCEIVRASYGINGSVPYDVSDVDRIKVIVEAAIDEGLYVIIDWHAHDAHLNCAEAVSFFSMMASEYGQYDNVIFEVYNEPTQVKWSDVKAYAEEVISAIRKHSDNLIIVGSPTWSQDVDKAAADPIDDPNTAYTLHFYAGTHKKWLRDRAERAMADGIALFVTEWGSVNADGNGKADKTSTLEWVNWCNKNGISMCNWAINDKAEGSSIFTSNDTLTETGEFIMSLIAERTKQSEWRTGTPYEYSE